MSEERFRVVEFGRYLHSMVFPNSSKNDGEGIVTTTVGFWGSADDARRVAVVVTAMAGIALAVSLVYR